MGKKKHLRIAYKDGIKRRAGVKGRWSDHNPGRGWTYKVEDGMFWIGTKIDMPGKLSSSQKSWTIATTSHQYYLDEYGLPEHFVVANFCKSVPTADVVPLAKIRKDLGEED